MKTIFLLFFLGIAPYIHAQSNFVGSASDQLVEDVLRLDSILFAASFDNCNLEILDSLLSDHLEFYHDKWGMIASSAEQFKEGVRSNCADQASGKSPRARRELIKRSVKIYPMNRYGALQTGKHLFYQLKDGRFQFTESALFTHLWQQTEDGWKLTRVLSYDHKPER